MRRHQHQFRDIMITFTSKIPNFHQIYCSFSIHLINARFHEKQPVSTFFMLFFLSCLNAQTVDSFGFSTVLKCFIIELPKLFMLSALSVHIQIHRKFYTWYGMAFGPNDLVDIVLSTHFIHFGIT